MRDGRKVRQTIEADGDRLTDLHLWRLGPGHLGAIVSLQTTSEHDPDYYHRQLARFRVLSHVTVEVRRLAIRPLRRPSAAAETRRFGRG